MIKKVIDAMKPFKSSTKISPSQEQMPEIVSPQDISYGKADNLSKIQKPGPTTRIIVKYDVGFNNSVFIRGQGANLSWEKGIMLKNIKADEWIWETQGTFTSCEFKVLINDRQYELGENHRLQCGASFEYTPHFHHL